MALQYSPKIVTDSLVMCLDASNNKSYPAADLPVKGGLVMWMDAADDTTFSYSSGTTVSQWRDKSGFNYHMVPKSSGPTRNAFLNSRKALAFTTSQTIGNDTINLASSANTVFVVSRLTGVTNGRVLTCNLDSGGNNWLLGHHGGTSNAYYAEGWVYDSSGASTSFQIYMGDWSGSSTDLANFYINGTAYATNNTAASAGPNKLGINYYSIQTSTCEAAEIIVFNRVLSTAERRLVHTYLGQKWGISNTDRSIVDLAGNDDNGLFGNGSTSNMPLYDYYNKGSFKFFASNKYIKLGNTANVNQFTGDFTVSLWAMATAENANYGNLIGDYYTAGVQTTNEWQIMMNNSSAFLNVYRHGTGYIINNTSSGFSANTWINVVLTRVGTAVTLYANNNVIGTATNSSVFGSATGSVNIGIDGNNAAEPFSGLISNVLIYKKGLSAAEVAQNYEAQKSKFANTIVQQGLVLNLDAGNPYSYAGAGSVWYDVSGNANHATLYNSPTWNSSGYFSLNGTNNYIKTTSTLNLSTYNAVTVLVIFKARSYPASGNVKFICELTTDFNSFQTGFVWTYNDFSGSQNYEIIAGVKGDAGYDLGSWNKNNYNDLNWEITTAVFNKGIASPETSLYNQGVVAGVISNPIAGLAANNTNNFGNDYLFIGCRGGTSHFTDLDIASILVYNRALSAAEILQNYNAMKGRFGL